MHTRTLPDPFYIAEGPPPRELLDRIDRLEDSLLTATEFRVPFDQFDDDLAISPNVFAYSDPTPNESLHSLLDGIVRPIVPTFELREHLMFEVRGTGFFHGMGTGKRAYVYYFYFEPKGVGLIGIHDPFVRRGPMLYIRMHKVPASAPCMPGPVVRGQA